jgi:hypothetical protein
MAAACYFNLSIILFENDATGLIVKSKDLAPKSVNRIDITASYRISSTQNEGVLTGDCFGNSSILGGHSSKADSYH